MCSSDLGELRLTQQFQMLSGTLGSTGFSGGRVRGDVLTFTVAGTTYTGTVNGSSIKGTAPDAWTATKR